jgi:ribosomal protein S6
MDKELKNYEIAFLVKSEEDQGEIIKILKNSQLPVIGEGRISKIKLAYPIKKENFAFSGYLYFSGSSQDIRNLTNSFKNEPKILRFSVIAQPIVKKDERGMVERASSRQVQEVTPQLPKKPTVTETLSNEALEKKLEEILQ